jgi:hypothetical protein
MKWRVLLKLLIYPMLDPRSLRRGSDASTSSYQGERRRTAAGIVPHGEVLREFRVG